MRLTDELISEFQEYWRKWDEEDKLLEGRNNIVRCMCPQLYGLSTIKLAVTLALVGSTSFTNKEVSAYAKYDGTAIILSEHVGHSRAWRSSPASRG